MRERVHVGLGERAYDIEIGPGLLAEAGRLIKPLLARDFVAVITDETVARLHLDTLRAGLEAEGISMVALALPAGEATKGWAQFSRAVEWLLEAQVERSDVLGLAVSISHRDPGGSVQIRYGDLDQLDEIVRRLERGG